MSSRLRPIPDSSGYYDAHLATVMADLAIIEQSRKVSTLVRELAKAQGVLAVMVLERNDLVGREERERAALYA